jgi:sugar phosphate isomerase/epimerase
MKLACQEGLVPGASFPEKLANLEAWGYEGIELPGNGLEGRVKEIARACAASKVKPAAICGGWQGCLLEADRGQRELFVPVFKHLLSLGGELGAVGVILVPIFGGPRLPDLSPLGDARKLETDLLLRLLEDLGKHAEKANCLVLVEPLNRYETHFLNRLEQAVAICEKAASLGVKIMADFFHMNIEEADIAASLRAAGPWVQHVHLADSNRLQPGQGHTDFAPGFRALKEASFDKYLSFECGIRGDAKTELPRSAQFLRKQM